MSGLPFVFANQTQPNLEWLDADFNAVGALTTLPCIIAGTNAITLAQTINTPAISAYGNYLRFSGIIAVDNTGATTAQVGSLGALPVYKDTVAGPVALTGGELQAGNYAVFTYDSALNSGGGGFHVSVPTSGGGVGTVTSVGSGTGLTGGPITGAGSLSLASLTTLQILANITGSTNTPTGNTLSAILDAVIGTTVGGVLVRGSSVWGGVDPLANALALRSTSTGAAYGGSVSATTTATGSVQGDAAVIGSCNLVVFTSVGSGTGGILPATTGLPQMLAVLNRGGNNLKIYPQSGGQIEALGANAADTVVSSTGNAIYSASASGQWYRVVAS